MLESTEVPEAAGNATSADWAGYPREALQHPMRNHPRFVSWLIAHYSKEWDVVYDPMAGVGTMMREADKLCRVGVGREIVDEYRATWPAQWSMRPEPADLVITSPDYWGNHGSGKTQRQYELNTRAGSNAGHELILVPGSIGGKHDWTTYLVLLWTALADAALKLKDGGYFIVIVRNRIVRARENNLTDVLQLLLMSIGLRRHAQHWRRLEPTHQWQKRAKLVAPGQLPPPRVKQEVALVWQKH